MPTAIAWRNSPTTVKRLGAGAAAVAYATNADYVEWNFMAQSLAGAVYATIPYVEWDFTAQSLNGTAYNQGP